MRGGMTSDLLYILFGLLLHEERLSRREKETYCSPYVSFWRGAIGRGIWRTLITLSPTTITVAVASTPSLPPRLVVDVIMSVPESVIVYT